MAESKQEPILEYLRQEISDTQQRQEKLQLLKIGFVSAILGFVGGEFKGFYSLYQALYVVPLIATFFYLLIVSEHFKSGALARFYG